MFEKLTDNLMSAVQKLRGRISVNDVKQAILDIKKILIESDVSVHIVNEITQHLHEHANTKSIKTLQNNNFLLEEMHKILIKYLSHDNHGFNTSFKRILMIGLQGSGKTTMCGKIAHKLNNKKITLVSLDNTRPAAKEQLQMIAGKTNVSFYTDNQESHIIARQAIEKYQDHTIIFDTSGRYNDMEELMTIQAEINPDCIVFVADSTSGQNIYNIVQQFSNCHINYIALSRMDSNAKIGSVLTVSHMLKKPILLLGTGEKPHEYEEMNVIGMVNRILDKGDVITLAEKAKKEFKNEENKNINEITLSDLILYMDKIQKMGGLANILSYLPGMSKMKGAIKGNLANNKQMIVIKAIVHSMTMKEKSNPYILTHSRKTRIAKGSGTTIQEIDNLVRTFTQMKQMISQMMRKR